MIRNERMVRSLRGSSFVLALEDVVPTDDETLLEGPPDVEVTGVIEDTVELDC